MMDSAEVIPPLVDCEKEPCVAGESQQPSPTAAVSKVLEDDDLLIEILLRLGFPTTLIHAALVCKRWLHQASDRKFLSRFRKRHPPRLLGFYIESTDDPSLAARFFPMVPQPPELAVVMRHASFNLDFYRSGILGCQNGSVLISLYDSKFTFGVRRPLRPERGLTVAPPLPRLQIQEGYFCAMNGLLPFKEEGDGLSHIFLWVLSNKERTKSVVQVLMLRNGDAVWRTHLNLATDRLLCRPRCEPKSVVFDDKIFIPSDCSDIIVLDLTTSSISTIQLPQGVEYGYRDTKLARADDASSLYLIHATKIQLRIWLHKGDNWLLTNTICFHEMVGNLRMSAWNLEDEPISFVYINQAGDYADSVFLEMGHCVVHLDIKCRQMRKVYDIIEDGCLGGIYPFMMIWPPTFPALKDDPARNAM